MNEKESLLTDRRPRPIVLIIADGIGYSPETEGNAVAQAYKPFFDWMLQNCPHTMLRAHGTAVGLPSDEDMGNSEVGHNAMGSGRYYPQGALLVNEALESGRLFEGKGWKRAIENCREHWSTLHFIGLLSDGNVHSHWAQLEQMLRHAATVDKIPRVRIHTLLDGRDVGETSALDYIIPFEEFLHDLRSEAGVDYRIASGGGRMKVTMDRYEADWRIVELGWKTHVAAVGPEFRSAEDAVRTFRTSHPGILDQDLPPFVIVDDHGPVGPIRDGDSVIFFNYRGDRAMEISRAFEEENFDKFERSPYPKVAYAGLMEYDTEAHIPKNYLVEPPCIEHTIGEYLSREGVRQMAISETQKYGHVTYFWNGNRSGKINDELEDYVEVPSDRVPFEQRPWMKAAEITDLVVNAVGSGSYDFIRLNFPNGDMVGHTGVFQAAKIAVETVDLCVGRIMDAVRAAGGILLFTADHGNAEEMMERDKSGQVKRVNGCPKAKTAHTLNPVWFVVYDPGGAGRIGFDPAVEHPGLTNIAATILQLLGITPPEIYDPPMLVFSEPGQA